MSGSWVKTWFWLYLMFLVGAFGIAFCPADPDIWHRFALGETLWRTGHFPPADAFSYLADYRQPADHEWGCGVLFYAAWCWGGGWALIGIKLVVLAATMILTVKAGWGNRPPTLLAAGFYAFVLLALMVTFNSTVRCMVFTHLFFALWLYWYRREKEGGAIRFVGYAGTMVVWANLHGGFTVGLCWLALLAVVEFFYDGPWRKRLLLLALCLLATLVNPFGFDLWRVTVRALMVPRTGFAEWGPVSWWSLSPDMLGYKLLLLWVVAVLGFHFHRVGWKRCMKPEIFLMGALLVVSLASRRHASLFAVAAGALLPEFLPESGASMMGSSAKSRFRYLAVFGALAVAPLCGAVAALFSARPWLTYPTESCPVGAVAYLERENVRGRLLVPFNYGSYALWQLRGKMQVAMDGRYDLVYRPETVWRVADFFGGYDDGQGLLVSPAPDAVLFPISDTGYVRMQANPRWKRAYVDGTDAVFLSR